MGIIEAAIQQTTSVQPKPRDEIIDFIRGSCALIVMISHCRSFLFRDFTELTGSSLLIRLFYLGTSVHYHAVMVFFVLSGYFVGGSVLDAVKRNRFSWKKYALARLIRLWVALIPALLLTALLDNLGRMWVPDAYAGTFYNQYMSGPSNKYPADLGLWTFAGNLVFLQTILCPTYGTNGPLWSLANEFWYYTLFPLGLTGFWALAIERKYSLYGLACLALTAGLYWWLPKDITSASLIWLMGVGVWIAARHPGLIRIQNHWIYRSVFGLVFFGSLAISKAFPCRETEYAVGFAFAFWMPSLLGTWPKTGWWTALSIGLSEISYTLYVTHFPFLFLVSVVFLKGRQFEPNLEGFSYYAGLTISTFVLACVMWWLFEHNTQRIRRRIVSGKSL